MKKTFNVLTSMLACALLSTTALASSDKLVLFPIFTDDKWEPNIEVAAVLGYVDYDKKNFDDGTIYGAEFSFDCPVFTLPGDHLLRQQLSLSQYNKNGFKVTTIEMNPYYFVNVTDKLVLGFGPGIGGVHGDPDNGQDQWLFSVQAGAGLKYYIDDFIIGADLRYQWTAEKNFSTVGGKKEDLDNMRFLLKAGYRF